MEEPSVESMPKDLEFYEQLISSGLESVNNPRFQAPDRAFLLRADLLDWYACLSSIEERNEFWDISSAMS